MLKKPQALDVLFTGGKEDTASFLSLLLQPISDPGARRGTRRFAHVALVLDEWLALEAVPLGDAPETGAYSGAQLRAGVRLVPVHDLLHPLWGGGAPFAVLRSRHADIAGATLALESESIAEVMASEYSLTELRQAAEAKLRVVPDVVTAWLRGKIDWSSPQANLGAQLVGDEVRRSLERTIPGFTFPFKTCTYFCSKLVAELLTKGGIAAFDRPPSSISPTGLFAVLTASADWMDVTVSDYAPAGMEPPSEAACLAAYTLAMEALDARLVMLGYDTTIRVLQAGTAYVQDEFQHVSDVMEELGWNDPDRMRVRAHEDDFVEELVEHAGIADQARRDRFRGMARDAVRAYCGCFVDYPQLLAFLATEAARD